MGEYSLVMKFPDQSESFVLGFEAGRIWGAMKARAVLINDLVHTEHAEFFAQMAERQSYVLSLMETSDPDWMQLSAEPRP